MRYRVTSALQAVALSAALLCAAAGCTSGGQPAAGTTLSTGTANRSASDGCAGQPPVTPLPAWARAGFTPADQAMPHVMGQAGDIVAILWAPRDALHAPARPDPHNKILWVSRVPVVAPQDLVIRATLAGTGRAITQTVAGGPGPSYVDVPVPGCWTFHLSWSGHADQLSLRYVA
jgi:hypothetical protein